MTIALLSLAGFHFCCPMACPRMAAASFAIRQVPLVVRMVRKASRRRSSYSSTSIFSTSIWRLRKAFFTVCSHWLVTSTAFSICRENSSMMAASSLNCTITASRLSKKRFFQDRFMVARPKLLFSCSRYRSL